MERRKDQNLIIRPFFESGPFAVDGWGMPVDGWFLPQPDKGIDRHSGKYHKRGPKDVIQPTDPGR